MWDLEDHSLAPANAHAARQRPIVAWLYTKSALLCGPLRILSGPLRISARSAVTVISPQSALRYAEERREEQIWLRFCCAVYLVASTQILSFLEKVFSAALCVSRRSLR
jgi:hypothetical protein